MFLLWTTMGPLKEPDVLRLECDKDKPGPQLWNSVISGLYNFPLCPVSHSRQFFK